MEAIYFAITILLFSLHCFPTTSETKNVSEYVSATSIPVDALKPYMYCDFTVTWRITACMLRTCRQGAAVQDFGIHGLWPGNRTADEKNLPVTYCGGQAYSSSLITGNLRTQMDAIWPSVYTTKTNDQFWGDEWDKHGTCFDSGTYTVVDYFNKAVALGNSYSVPLWVNLRTANITAGVAYPVNTITQAIRTASGNVIPLTSIQLQCLNNSKTGNKKVVYQIFFCVDRTAQSFTACPSRREMCSGNTMFPA